MSQEPPLRPLYSSSKDLAEEKVAARETLLSMPPRQAQQQADQTLYPQLWQLQPGQVEWEESIETCYGEIDA